MRTVIWTLLLIGLPACRSGSVTEHAAPSGTVTVTFDREKGIATIVVPAREGRVAWSDMLRGIARSKGFDDDALQGVLPDVSIDIADPKTPLILAGLNLALSPHVRFDVLDGGDAKADKRLRIAVNRKALLASSRWLRNRLREALRPRFSNSGDGGEPYGLALDPAWEKAPPDKKLVVFIHGLHSTPERAFESFDEEVRKQGFPVGTFGYPNDQPVETSARSLAEALRAVGEKQPQRRIALVTTSLGGLVARAMVEDPEVDPGNVCRLTMIAPPTHGSRLAELAFAMELWEHVAREEDKSLVQRFYSTIEDGLGEAYEDLTPESDFLRRLNARPRNPNVSYTVFLGSAGFLDEETVAAARAKLKQAGERNRFVQFFGARLDEILADLDEVKRGKGDGAVSITRGRLEGVEDTIVVPFNHLTMLSGVQTEGERQLRREILERLRAK